MKGQTPDQPTAPARDRYCMTDDSAPASRPAVTRPASTRILLAAGLIGLVLLALRIVGWW